MFSIIIIFGQNYASLHSGYVSDQLKTHQSRVKHSLHEKMFIMLITNIVKLNEICVIIN